jgi:hypothetical protein
MKMAKSSKDDVRKVIAFFRFIEEFMEYGTHTPENEEFEEDSIDLTDEQFVEMLRKMWGGRFKPAGVDCMWMPVVFGYDVLVENCCDDDSDVLELRSDWTEAIEAAAEIEELKLYKRAMESMAAQFIHPKTTALELAKSQLGVV